LGPIEAGQAPPGAEQSPPTLKQVSVLRPLLGYLLIQQRSFVEVSLCFGEHRLGGEPSMLVPCRACRRMVDELLG
jgi:hypothetical protein